MYLNNQRKLNVIIFMMLILIISGCATKMPLTKNMSQLSIEKEGVAIMSLKISNQYVPSYQPDVRVVEVNELGETNTKSSFKVEKAYDKLKNQYNKYLISFQLSPGKYKVGRVLGGSGIFPVAGHFEFPVDAEFEVSSNKITYIGYIEMVNRKRKDGEPRSGGIFPLIDQAATGFSGGTFDIIISDSYNKDIKVFKENYPFIQNYEVKKNIAVLIAKKSKN